MQHIVCTKKKWMQIFKGSQGTWEGDLGRLSQAAIDQTLKALADS